VQQKTTKTDSLVPCTEVMQGQIKGWNRRFLLTSFNNLTDTNIKSQSSTSLKPRKPAA